MKKKFNFCFLFFLFCFQTKTFPQNNFPDTLINIADTIDTATVIIQNSNNYFRSPVDIPLAIVGNFGELRNNHFHTGLDIRTQSVEGKKIYAVADGFVSRIKISSFGYGKTLYIAHSNGFVSVYAHLKALVDTIDRFAKFYQYQQEKFEIELFPDSNLLRVKKGDVVALSGNTGGSSGPHLHFEIREDKTERPVNPMLFGYLFNDKTKPIIREIIVYPMNDSSLVYGYSKKIVVPMNGNAGKYFAKNNQIIVVSGAIGFGIKSVDMMNGSANTYGVYSTELLVDSEKIYSYTMDKFYFDEKRCINHHIDYEESRKSGIIYEKSFLPPNNLLSIYENTKNRGIVDFTDDRMHSINYIVKDFNGNTTTATFKIKSQSRKIGTKVKNQKKPEVKNQKPEIIFPFNQENIFENEQIKVEFPSCIFYENINFEYSVSKKIKGSVTPVHHIHQEFVPIHSNYTISFKLDSVSEEKRKKCLIVWIGQNGQIVPQDSCKLNGNIISAKPKVFGVFAVMMDVSPPNIVPINISPNKNLINQNTIKIKIVDGFSGIASYRGTIDEQWVLMEYEYKQELLTYYFDEKIKKGKHLFKLEVKDKCGNARAYMVNFIR